MEISKLNEIDLEIIRFMKKLKDARVRMKEPDYDKLAGTRETGALKRAALDLKNLLTDITR